MKITFNIYKVLVVILALLNLYFGYKLYNVNNNYIMEVQKVKNYKQELDDIRKVLDRTQKDLDKFIIKEKEMQEIKQAEKHLGDNENESYFMTCRITHYSSEETGSNVTASGKIARLNHTIACNTLPFGTQVRIGGVIYTVEDTGDMDGNGIDIYVSCSEEAFECGTYITEVEVL